MRRFLSLIFVIFLAACAAPSAVVTPTPTLFPTTTPIGPETTPNSPRPYPTTLTVETAQQGISAVDDAPSTITGLSDVQLILAKHTQLARDAGLSFDHMAVKYVATDQRWFLVPVQSDGTTIAGWLEIADPSSQSGWRFGEQPTWDSRYSPSKDTYQYGLPALHDPANHFETGFVNGFPVLIEVTPSESPQYWNNIAQKTTLLVEGALVSTPTPTPTPNAEATKQAEFETRKAEALKMVSIQLNSPEDFNTLPVLDDAADFDSGKVQEAEYWLMDNVLPPAPENLKLPDSWHVQTGDTSGFCNMMYNLISEGNVDSYRGVDAFFVMRDGKKMLRLGVQYGGGEDQLIHFNFEDPKWWTDPIYMKTLIATFHHTTDVVMFPMIQYGTLNNNQLRQQGGYMMMLDASDTESYSKKVALERSNQFANDWASNRQLPEGADRTVFGARFFVFVK